MSLQKIIEISENISTNSQILADSLHQLSIQQFDSNFFATNLTIFILSAIIGYLLTIKINLKLNIVANYLINLISSVIIIVSIISLGTAKQFGFNALLAFFAIIILSINIVVNFIIGNNVTSILKNNQNQNKI